jgi:rubrerythrin
VSATTRREALRLGVLAGGALAVPALLRPAIARADDDEAELEDFLEAAIDLEQAAVFAYQAAAEAKDIDAGHKRVLETFRDHEQEHADALGSALESLGFDPPDPPTSAADAEALGGLEGLRSAVEHLRFLIDLEEQQLELYLGRTPAFESEDLLRLGAEISACQAQHIVVLREDLGAPPAEALPTLPSAPDSDG